MDSTSQGRITRLRTALDSAGLQAALITRPQHLFYYTGVQTGTPPAMLLITPTAALLVAPSALEGWESFPYRTYDIYQGWSIPAGFCRAAEQAIARANLHGSIGVEEGYLPASLLPALQGAGLRLQDLNELLWQQRRIRDAGEITRIRHNVALNDRIFSAFSAVLQPGIRDFELWALVYRMLCEGAGKPIALEADLGIGSAGLNPGAKPSGAIVQATDPVFLDIYSARDGYYADTTRAFCASTPDARQREIHAILLEAQLRGMEALQPGVRACDVDQAVRTVIEKAGYGAYFGHHAGHAFNFFQQDIPYFIPAETKPVEEGMTVTLEPGIYLPGWGGMRLERNYLITASGAEVLDTFPLDLV